MSPERFEWLKTVAGEVWYSGTESNVKEIYDKVWELQDPGQHHDLQPV